MSQDMYGARAPPPPPPPAAASTSPQSTTVSAESLYQAPQVSPLRRLAVQPPRLRTVALAPQQQAVHQSQTPASASTLNIPYSPFAAASPSTYAPSPLPSASPMAMRNTSVPYNPQQWGRNGPVSGQYAPHTVAQTATRAHDMTGMEGNSRPFLTLLILNLLCSISPYSRSNSTLSSSLTMSNMFLYCCRVQLNFSSSHAVPPSAVLARPTTTEHISNPEFWIPSATRQCFPLEPSPSPTTANRYTFVLALGLWLPESSRVHGHTVERDKHNIKSTISASTIKEWTRTICVA
jgi:hypothetical protein